jgi:ParB-like chromosome segregation protein Spo0J
MKDLAESIRAKGLLQPVMVRRRGDGYEIVFSLHRLDACRRRVGERFQP